MIKLFEMFGEYKFNDKVVTVKDTMVYGSEYRVVYVEQGQSKENAVILDNKAEFDELFIPILDTKKEKNDTRYKIVYVVNNKVLDTIKHDIANYSLARYFLNKLKVEPQFRRYNAEIRIVEQ